MELLIGIGAGFLILLYSAILHEVAHGLVADRLGDPTARLMGRLTLNPFKHIDPFLSVILPLILFISRSPVIFGGAKPVPVDPFNLKEGRKDVALVSLAGPLTNVLIAIIATILMKLFVPHYSYIDFLRGDFSNLVGYIGLLTVQLNLLLAIFNLLPIPPLDGSKVFALLLPTREAQTYLSLSNIGIFILFFLLAFPIAGFSLGEFISNILMSSLHLLGW